MTEQEKTDFGLLVNDLKRISISINNDYAHLIEEDENMIEYKEYIDSNFESIKLIPKK